MGNPHALRQMVCLKLWGSIVQAPRSDGDGPSPLLRLLLFRGLQVLHSREISFTFLASHGPSAAQREAARSRSNFNRRSPSNSCLDRTKLAPPMQPPQKTHLRPMVHGATGLLAVKHVCCEKLSAAKGKREPLNQLLNCTPGHC